MTNRLILMTMGAQGLYYMVTGIWPLLSMSTFLAVTGPKFDLWLVDTVGLLVLCSGGVMSLAARRKSIAPEILLLAVSNAVALIAVDVIFVSAGRISPIYLADAFAEVVLLAGYAFGMAKQQVQNAERKTDR